MSNLQFHLLNCSAWQEVWYFHRNISVTFSLWSSWEINTSILDLRLWLNAIACMSKKMSGKKPPIEWWYLMDRNQVVGAQLFRISVSASQATPIGSAKTIYKSWCGNQDFHIRFCQSAAMIHNSYGSYSPICSCSTAQLIRWSSFGGYVGWCFHSKDAPFLEPLHKRSILPRISLTSDELEKLFPPPTKQFKI